MPATSIRTLFLVAIAWMLALPALAQEGTLARVKANIEERLRINSPRYLERY